MAPNYPGSKDAMAGFKRCYKGRVAEESCTKLGRLDYAAGMSKDIQLFAPGVSADEDVIMAVGAPMLGMFNSSQWNHDFDNPQNKRIVPDFEKDYGRLLSLYAAQRYDEAMLIDAALRDVKGDLRDRDAVRKALERAGFKSSRGAMKFNADHCPVQNYYPRVISGDAQGRISNKTMDTIFDHHADAYVAQCRMK